jgi:predicted anti-sigma-YlaC factor YlaD
MKQCWSEGELRAYLDCELPPRDMERVTAHVETCAGCGAIFAELSGRAHRLEAWMQALPEPEPVTCLPAAPRRAFSVRWAGIAAGIAAAAVLGVAFWPNPIPKVTATASPPIHIVPAPPPLKAEPPAVKLAIIRAAPHVAPAKPKPQIQYYFALDNEPIETGVVVRVGLDGGQIPADVIVGPDGRARAFRLVSDTSGELK